MFERRGYLLDVTYRRPAKRVLDQLVDILAKYCFNEFFLYSEAESVEGVDLKRLGLYCEMQGLRFRLLDKSAWEEIFLSATYACAGTESARSLAGRVEEMRERMEKAEEMGRTRKLKGFLVTDFADPCAWQPLCVSLPGIIMGGNFASSGAKASKMDLEKELDAVMDVPLGGLLLRLGTLYLRGGAIRADASELFNILKGDVGYSRHPGLTDHVLEDISGVAHGVAIAAERWAERSDWAKEILYAANLVDCACHRRDESRLRALRDEHGRIWRLRSTEEGRVESLCQMPRF